MLEREFRELTGVDDYREYVFANNVYMRVSSDKFTFCREWLMIRESKVLVELMEKVMKAEDALSLELKRLEELKNSLTVL